MARELALAFELKFFEEGFWFLVFGFWQTPPKQKQKESASSLKLALSVLMFTVGVKPLSTL
jgi:hypothetical protein